MRKLLTCVFALALIAMTVFSFGSAYIMSKAAAADFDADFEPDAVDGDKLAEKYGPMSDIKHDFSGLRIGFVVKTLANESWGTISDGVNDFLKDYGLKVDLQAPKSESDQAEQLQIVESMLNKDYDVLMLSPQSNTTLDPAVRQANKMNLLVVNPFDAQIAEARCFIGNISIETGQLGAQYLVDKIGGKGKVACIEGLAGAYAAIQRTAGFHKKMAEFPNIEVVASVPADWDRQRAMNVATDLINQYGEDLKGIYCNNDTMALGAIEAVKAAGLHGKILVVGTDGIPGAFESVKIGDLTATVDLNLFAGGRMAGEAVLRLVAGQNLARVVKVPQVVVDAENIAKFGY